MDAYEGISIVRKWTHKTGFKDNTDFVGMLANGDYIIVSSNPHVEPAVYNKNSFFSSEYLIKNAIDNTQKGIWVEV